MKAKIKRRRRKPTAHTERIKSLTADILSGTISGLLTALIIKWLNR